MDSIKTTVDALVVTLDKLEQAMHGIPPEVRQQRIKDHEEFVRRQKEELLTKLLDSSRAPQRQLVASHIERNSPWGSAEKKIGEKLGTGCLIALIGIRGCGKTQLGVEAIRKLAEEGKRSRYATATEFFMEIKASYDKEGRSEKDVINEFSRPLLLVMDEIGQRSESEWENRLLFELLNRRYNSMKDTILISNQSAEAFTQSMGPSLISRMIETGGLIECHWPSYRK